MIPKILHYCWFGGAPLPKSAQACLDSWRTHCPDYTVMRWDESNTDLSQERYLREATAARRWAFVSDVVRLQALVKYGGIYLDTDVELIRPLDAFLSLSAFAGFEAPNRIQTALLACEAGHPLFVALLHTYDDAAFQLPNGKYDETPNVVRLTALCQQHGLVLNNTKQTLGGLTLFPTAYFCPKDFATGRLTLTENTHAIHHFDGSWLSDEQRWFEEKRRAWRRWLPRGAAGYLAKASAAVRFRGVRGLLSDVRARRRR